MPDPKPKFNPNQPFEPVKPKFDPNKPFDEKPAFVDDPNVATPITDLAMTVYSGFTDQVPQTLAQGIEVAKSSITPTNIAEYIRNKKPVDFQRYVRDKDPEFAGTFGFLKPFGEEGFTKYIPQYGKEFMEKEGLGAQITRMEKDLPKVIERRKQLEEYVQQQKKEAAEKTVGIVQDYRKVNNVADFSSYIAGLAGQAVYQMPLSVATRGGSSYLMEAASVYDKQLDNLAKENKITREQVIERNLDKPAAGQIYAMLAGAMDAASAGNVIGAFRKSGGSLLKKWITNAAPEAATEAAQSVLENVGAGSKDPFNVPELINSAIGGAVGGTIFSFNGISEENEIADKMVAETDTGDAALNSQIDADAALTPEEEELLKTNTAQKRVGELIEEEKKLTKDAEKVRKDQERSAEVGETTEASKTDSSSDLQQTTEAGAETSDTQDQVSFNETPEYKAADQKVRDIADQIRQNPDQEQLFSKLNEAKQERDNARIAFEQKPTKIKQEKSIKMTPAEALKHQVQTFYKGVEKGVKKGKELTNDLVSKVQETLKEQNLTPKQTSVILSKVKNTNLFTRGSVSKLNQLIDRVSTDAAYAESLGLAESGRKFVKNKVKSKLNEKATTLSFDEKETLKNFVQIDPLEVKDVDGYNTIISQIKESFQSVKNNVPLKINAINEYVTKVVDDSYKEYFKTSPKNLTTEQKIQEIKNRKAELRSNDVKQNLADQLGLTFEESEKLLSDEGNVEKTIRESNTKEDIRQGLLDAAKEREVAPPDDITSKQQELVSNIKGIDLNLLSPEQLKLYIKAVDRINENGDFGGAGYIGVIATVQKSFKILMDKLGKSKILNFNAFEAYVSSSSPQAFQAIYGLPIEAAMFQLYLGIKGVSDAAASAVKEAEDFVFYINNIHKENTKLYGSKRNGFSDESQFRQGIYLELLRHPENVNPVEALNINKEAIEQSMENLNVAGMTKEASKLQSLYEPFAKVTTLEEVSEIMSEIDHGGKRVADSIVKYYEKFYNVMTEYNELYFNKRTTKVNNYGGGRKWIKQGLFGDFDIDGIEDLKNVGNLSVIAKPRQATSARDFKNLVRKDAVIDFNLHKKASDQIQDMVFRSEAIPYMLQVRESLKNKKDLLKLFGYKDGDSDSKKKANDLYKKIFDPNEGVYFGFERDSITRGKPTTTFEKGLNSVLNTLRKVGYTLTLSGPTQAIKQATVLSSVARHLGGNQALLYSSVSDAIMNPEDFKKFIRGETVSMRGEEKSLFNLGDFYTAANSLEVENKLKQVFTRGIPKYMNKKFEGWMGIKPLTKSDTSVAQASFLAFYKEYLKKNNVDFINLTEENNLRKDPVRQEARAYAKQMVDNLQVVSNPAELSQFMKDKSWQNQFLKAWLTPYGTYTTNTKERLWSNYRAILTGNSKQRAFAFKDIQATIVEFATYQIVSKALKIGVYGGIGYIIRELLDLDDKEDKEERNKRMMQSVVTEGVVSNLPLMLGAPGEDMLVDAVNETAYQLSKIDNPDLTKKEFSAPMYRYESKHPILDYLGVYGVPIERSAQGFELLGEALNNDELSKDQKRLAAFAATMQFAQMAAIVPADAVNATMSEVRRQLYAKEPKNQPNSNKPFIPKPTIQKPYIRKQ
jgi:hypothetical protein